MPVDWALVPPPDHLGAETYARMTRLFPIFRSMTGEGLRQTLRAIGDEVPVELVETPTGTQVFDWTAPREWNVRGAWIEAPDGTRVVDVAESNLHLVGYSVPVDVVLSLDELRPHLHTHPTDPELVPYRTSYWVEDWGFCLSRRVLDGLQPGRYRAVVDTTLAPGAVTYAEAMIRGATTDEVLLTTYACHPSLANDNLSGVAVLTEVGRALASQPGLRLTYRLVWGPGTIGPLCWLARNEADLGRIRHGLTVSCVGDPGHLTYKRSRRGDVEIDEAAAHVVSKRATPGTVVDWAPWGGDERQYCSPGFDLPLGALSRTPADRFPGYHSSGDDLALVRPEHLGDSVATVLEIVDVLESNGRYVNRSPYGEPQLGRRGLYEGFGARGSQDQDELALLWVLSLSDGSASLLDVAERAGLPFAAVRRAAHHLEAHGLVERAP